MAWILGYWKIIFHMVCGTVISVSYTHLDVYKRQVILICECSYLNVPTILHVANFSDVAFYNINKIG